MCKRHKPQKATPRAVESAMQRAMRIDDSQNGATLRTRVIKDKHKYQRYAKHKTSFAPAEDFFLRYSSLKTWKSQFIANQAFLYKLSDI